MNMGGKQFHTTTKFIRRFMSIKSKLLNQKNAVSKKVGKTVMKTMLLTQGFIR